MIDNSKWQQIEHRKWLKLKKENEPKEEEPELMTPWSKNEHKKWVKMHYNKNKRNLES